MEISKSTYAYKAVTGCTILADIYRRDARNRQPVLIWLHGGALICGSRTGISQEHLREYVQAGYTVVALDYRLAPETPLSGILEDICDAFTWTASQLPAHVLVDPEHIGVIGHSAGGYLALAAGYIATPRPQAIVSWYGYGDIAGAWYSRPDPHYCQQPPVSRDRALGAVGQAAVSEEPSAPRSDFYLYCRQQGLWPKMVTGHDPLRDTEWFSRICPLQNITPTYPPTLLLHGDVDSDVPYEQSVLMSRALAQHGVEHELITMSGYDHGFDQAPNRSQDPAIQNALQRVLAFLDAHVW